MLSFESAVKCPVEPGMSRLSDAVHYYSVANADYNFMFSALISPPHALLPGATLASPMLIHCYFMDLENNLQPHHDVKH